MGTGRVRGCRHGQEILGLVGATKAGEHEDGQWMWGQSGTAGTVKDTERREAHGMHVGIIGGYWDSQGEHEDGLGTAKGCRDSREVYQDSLGTRRV